MNSDHEATLADLPAMKARCEAFPPARWIRRELPNRTADYTDLCRLIALVEALVVERDAALEREKALRATVEEVRRRMVTDHYTGTGLYSPHFWACHICSWIWKAGEAELHEPSCPLAALEGVKDSHVTP